MTQLGFVGLGNMGFPMMSRLVAAGHSVVVFDTRSDVLERAEGLGALRATSVRDVADRADCVLASLPSQQAALDVAVGTDGVAGGTRVRRYVDLSTIGSQVAQRIHAGLADHDIAALDCPVSGGVAGAEKGTLALMVSGDAAEFETVQPVLEVLGRPILVGTQPGAAQTMKLVNNLLAATALAATAEAVVMGVKAGLDPTVVIDVLNAGSGGTHASRDKFPRAVLPRTFDYGFATGLMVKDVRLYLDEARALALPTTIADAVAGTWESVLASEGAESDFTSVVKPLEAAAGVIVDGRGERANPIA